MREGNLVKARKALLPRIIKVCEWIENGCLECTPTMIPGLKGIDDVV
jgi:hypothetical protein